MTTPPQQPDRSSEAEEKPVPVWDLLIFKLAGASAVVVALLDPYLIGQDRDWRLLGIGLVLLGGREFALRVLRAIGGITNGGK